MVQHPEDGPGSRWLPGHPGGRWKVSSGLGSCGLLQREPRLADPVGERERYLGDLGGGGLALEASRRGSRLLPTESGRVIALVALRPFHTFRGLLSLGQTAVRVPTLSARGVVGDIEPRAAGIFDVLVDRGGLEAAPRAIEPEAGYLASRSSRHQRGQIAPEIVGAEVGLGAADPGLGAAHVLDHERDISASGLAGFALDAELSPEQG